MVVVVCLRVLTPSRAPGSACVKRLRDTGGVATPPRITAADELDVVLARIQARHERLDDPRRSQMGTDPRDVLDYLQRNPARLPRWAAAADTQDALVLVTWLWWEDRRRERNLLRRGRHLGLSLSDLGAPLGVTSRRGLADRLDRLDALLEYDRPDEQLSRADRRQLKARPAEQGWIDLHRDEIRAVIAGLLAQAARSHLHSPTPGSAPVDDPTGDGEPGQVEGAWLDELRADYDTDHLTPATMALLGLAAAELRATRAVAELDSHHGLRRSLRAVEQLRMRFSRLDAATGADGA